MFCWGDFVKKILILLAAVFCLLLGACAEDEAIGIIGGADGPTQIYVTGGGEGGVYTLPYTMISQEDAKKIMDSGESYILLDVREQDEFDAGHIPGAILIPYTQIAEKAEDMLPDQAAQILVYCRSGRRSKIAAEALGALGYTDVKEFGGIIDWPYEVTK